MIAGTTKSTKSTTEIRVPLTHDWRTTDQDEINKRRLRAREESFVISNTEPQHPIFSNFQIKSRSGLTYAVEIRDLRQRQNVCNCVDFRINGLGTCKHVEAALIYLQARFRRLFLAAQTQGSPRIDIIPDPGQNTLRVAHNLQKLPRILSEWFDDNGYLCGGSMEEALTALEKMRASGWPQLRVSQEVAPWRENCRREVERKELRREYEMKVQSGAWPSQETKAPLFPYQREGMLHLAFAERALLADEMGLGKTIQAIAACSLLHRMGKAERVLVVTPASLKTEWEEQIQRFTDLPYQLVFGARFQRLKAYQNAPFFSVVNYEQMLADALDVNASLRPDIVILDEAQRIKNWSTKTAQAIKRLRSRYAFVLTGTPIENRIDDLQSLMDFLNPSVLGPLFRFNREYYDLDERGRPRGYRNLDQLHDRIKPYLLRRRKAEVETELPDRTDRNFFVPLSEPQKESYAAHEQRVARLIQIAHRRPLSQQEQEKLQRELAMMRMICDTNYILDPEDRICPKLTELEKILVECQENEAKVLVFSEWERMLELVRRLCERLDLGFAWHTGSVPQRRRRAEINAFKSDPDCRVFLSTDSGSTGLNLQVASVVINCDLPWNPAKLEQRIARAWRKHQTQPVTVINLVAEQTIEHRMLDTLANKQALADGVLDRKGDLKEIKLTSGRQAFLNRLQQLMRTDLSKPLSPDQSAAPPARPLLADRALAFAQLAREKLNQALVRCEERFPNEGVDSVLVVVVDRDPGQWQTALGDLHQELVSGIASDPSAPRHLEVIDRATDETIQRLIAAGLIAKTTRAVRPLYPAEQAAAIQPLSEAEKQKSSAHRVLAERKMKMARLLGEGGMDEEVHGPLSGALQALACAWAIENRWPEPTTPQELLLPPLAHCWKSALPLLKSYIIEPGQPWKPVVEHVATLL